GIAEPLSVLYERHVGDCVRLARLLTGDRDIAEDLAHEAFIRVAGRFRHFRGASEFEAYLRRTVVNLSRSRLRRLRMERHYLPRVTQPAQAEAPAEPRSDVWRAIRSLPYRQRAAVVLRYYADLSEEATARVLGCTPRAVNSLVVRAVSTLRQRLRDEEDTGE